MTRAQQTKLNTIIGKLEALENNCKNKTQEQSDAMRSAKSALLRILEH